MKTSPDYQPPASRTIKTRQNGLDALRLLVAQRRLYRRAKRWLGFRWLGMVVIGIGAPVVSVIWPSLAVAASAVAGVWLFLGRTVIVLRQTAITTEAASVQEQFDLFVFDMPDITDRSTRPSLEAIAALVGPDDEVLSVADAEKLTDWYPIDNKDDGLIAVAIAQRANASYSNRLLRVTANVWAAVVAVWSVLLVGASIAANLTLAQFLMGVAFPVLPAFLDVVQYVAGVRRSATEKADLATLIEDHLSGRRDPVNAENLLVWQAQMFELRRSAPEVPDFIYKWTRPKNERVMKAAARQLGQRVRRQP